MAHSYFLTGDAEEGIERANAFAVSAYGLQGAGNADVITLRHSHLSVEDARRLRSLAELSPTTGTTKVLIITASRLFHEAQNALLKLFEEPPAGTVLILIVPSEGLFLPTLKSRLVELPDSERTPQACAEKSIVTEFLSSPLADREKLVTKLIDRTKADKEEDKQAARLAAIELLEGLVHTAYARWHTEKDSHLKKEMKMFLDDVSAFVPILHERSAPLKLIFEHILLTIPELG